MKTGDEYYARSVALKSILQADEGLLRKIGASFDALIKYRMLPKDMLHLGSGSVHTVAGVGSIQNPLTDSETFLALKMSLPHYHNEETLAEQIISYENAFVREKNPPFFISAIKVDTLDGMKYGMLMEDVSQGKKLKLLTGYDSSHCLVVLPNGEKVPRFIDPFNPDIYRGKEAMRYFSDEARIEVPKIE